MGDVVHQDRAFTLPILHKLVDMYEQEYWDKQTPMTNTSMCSVMFLLVACLGGMRGYEVV